MTLEEFESAIQDGPRQVAGHATPRPASLIRAYLGACQRHGVEVLENEAVTGVLLAGGKVAGVQTAIVALPDVTTPGALEAFGEVIAGFSKQEILKPPKEDPSAPDGVFARVKGLLSDLRVQ